MKSNFEIRRESASCEKQIRVQTQAGDRSRCGVPFVTTGIFRWGDDWILLDQEGAITIEDSRAFVDEEKWFPQWKRLR